MKRILSLTQELLSIPSPSGYTQLAASRLVSLLGEHGIRAQTTHKGAVMVGLHPEPRLVVTGHFDTLGAMVTGITKEGQLRFSAIGGINLPSLDGEYVSIYASDSKRWRGTILLNNPSVHASREANTKERTTETMHIRLDAETTSRDATEALGIAAGDFIAFDSRWEHTETGFVKGRFLDDKAGCACILDTVLSMGSEGLSKYPVCFFFSNYEEVGHGANSGFPSSCQSMLCVDMGVIGDDSEGSESTVSICAKDSRTPYDFSMRQNLVSLAKSKNIPHKVDVFPFYGSDGTAALGAGHHMRIGLIGPGVSASHGVERTHEKALTATRDLLHAFVTEGSY